MNERKRKITGEMIEDMMTLRKRGYNLREISILCDVSISSVQKHLYSCSGEKRVYRQSELVKKEREFIIKSIEQGKTQTEIAKGLGKTKQAIHNIIKKYAPQHLRNGKRTEPCQ